MKVMLEGMGSVLATSHRRGLFDRRSVHRVRSRVKVITLEAEYPCSRFDGDSRAVAEEGGKGAHLELVRVSGGL